MVERMNFDHKECGASFGWLPDSDGSESPEELWKALRRGLQALAGELRLDASRADWGAVYKRATYARLMASDSPALWRDFLRAFLRYCRGADDHLDDFETDIRDALAALRALPHDRAWNAKASSDFVARLNALARGLIPSNHRTGALDRYTVNHIDGWLGRRIVRRALDGMATKEEMAALLLVLRGRLADHRRLWLDARREAWRLCQIIHDPRIGRCLSFIGDGSGPRVARHRRRKKKANGEKPTEKSGVFLEPRLVVPPRSPFTELLVTHSMRRLKMAPRPVVWKSATKSCSNGFLGAL
jgi:hypothetical protein